MNEKDLEQNDELVESKNDKKTLRIFLLIFDILKHIINLFNMVLVLSYIYIIRGKIKRDIKRFQEKIDEM